MPPVLVLLATVKEDLYVDMDACNKLFFNLRELW